MGVAYSQTLSATGGQPPYSWSIVAGSLPAGLALAPSTGVLSGTPSAAGSINFTVGVSDDAQPTPQTATKTFSLAVTASAPVLNSLNPSSAIAGGPAFTLTVSGSNFVSNSTVRWNGANRTTTFVSSSQLTAAIPAADIATQGTASDHSAEPRCRHLERSNLHNFRARSNDNDELTSSSRHCRHFLFSDIWRPPGALHLTPGP